VTGLGTLRCLEAIKQNSPKTRFLHAATSELFGGESPEAYNEKSPMKPRSPYGCSKLFSYATTVNYKESYNLFAVNSISFNHESPRRKNVFISAKIISAACRIAKGLQDSLVVGNTSAMRDWSHAMDVCEAMQLILNADTPQDYVIASGESRSVEEFIRLVFGKLNLDYDKHVKISSKYYRPAEVQYLKGDSSKIRNELGWSPKYTFEMLVDEMIEYEMKEVEKELLLKGV
jgi:GDPmannose 4,6-dehydratase